MQTLFVRLSHNSDKVDVITQDANGTLIAIPQLTDINTCITNASDCQIILLAPGIDILSIEKNLPKMPINKLLKALPFSVEDQLLENIDDYHFVIAERDASGKTMILTTKNTQLNAWLKPWLEANFYCKALFPDYLLIPTQAQTWQVCVEKTALVRTGSHTGFSCDIDLMPTLLRLHWQQCPEALKPISIIIDNYLPNYPWIEEPWQDLPVTVISQTGSLTMSLAQYAKQASEQNNLLQGIFAQNQHAAKAKKLWQVAGGLMLTAFVVSIISMIIEFSLLKYQNTAIETKIATIYQRIYPDASSIVAPRVRIERTLKELTSHQLAGGYLGLLAATAQVLHQTSNIELTDLRYQDKKLLVDVQAPDFTALDALVQKLQKNALKIQQDQASSESVNQVHARLTIEEKNS